MKKATLLKVILGVFIVSGVSSCDELIRWRKIKTWEKRVEKVTIACEKIDELIAAGKVKAACKCGNNNASKDSVCNALYHKLLNE